VEALAELSDLVRDALRYYPTLRDVRQRWVLVDAAPKILAEIPSRLGDYAARELAGRGVEIRTSTPLESLDAHRKAGNGIGIAGGRGLGHARVMPIAGVGANTIRCSTPR